MAFLRMKTLFGTFLICSFTIYSTRGASVKGAFGGYLWEAFSDRSKEQSDAKTFCEGKGGWPAEPKTKEHSDYLTTLVSDVSVSNGWGHWIGLKKTNSELIWRWKNGDQAAWTNWISGGGNKNGPFLCTALPSSGVWKEAYCTCGSGSSNEGSFVCQWDLDPSDATKEYGGYLWERFETLATYPEAKAVCSARGGWPVEPRNSAINEELATFLAPVTSSETFSEYFIGLVFNTADSTWYWRGSVDFPTADSYGNWADGEGTGAGGGFEQHCAKIRQDTGKWFDVICDHQSYKQKIVCQTPLPTKSIIYDDYLLEVFNGDGNYEEAKALCTARGQWAAEPRSKELNDALTTILDNSYANGYFFGLKITNGEPRTWGTGDALGSNDYTSWAPGEPNRDTRGTVCTVTTGPDGEWHDMDCDYAPRRFSCQSPGYCRLRPNPCSNGGTCMSNESEPYFTCACTDGYFGVTCEELYCNSHSNPCQNGGTCESNLTPPGFYTCKCTSGRYGKTCTDKYCDYYDNPCDNGGNCTSTISQKPFYTCNCTPEYDEVNCSVPVYHEHGHCKYHINYNSLERWSFSSSNQSCATLGGTLAMDKDSSVHEFLTSSIQATYDGSAIDFWIGGEELGGDWYWLDTMSVIDYNSNWKEGEPDGTGQCMAFTKINQQYKWSGEICDTSRGRICEIPVEGEEPCISSDPCVNGKCVPTGCQWRCDCIDGYFNTTCSSDLIYIFSPKEVIAIANGTVTINVEVITYDGNITIEVYKDGVLDETQTKAEVSNNTVPFTFDPIEEKSEGEYLFSAFSAKKTYTRTSTTYMTVHDFCNVAENPCANNGNCTIISDDPYYRCDCTSGYVGYNCTELELGSPTIVEVISKNCSAEGILNVTWKPYEHATSVSHRVQAIPSTSRTTKELNIIPSGNELQMTILEELMPTTEYTVMITACPDLCIEELNDQRIAITGIGLPDAVVDPVVKQTNINSECKLSWTQPLSNIDEVEGYQINVTEFVVYQFDSNQIQQTSETDIESTTLEFSLTPEANREYSFAVQAKSCAGYGANAIANGKCVGGTSSPDLIHTPDVIDESPSSTRQIVIMFPDENNGPISCLFVIVKSGIISDMESFDINDLRKVSSDATDGVSYKYLEYLALAIPRNNITENTIYAKLGDDSVSGCDVRQIKSSMRASDNYYKAQNWPLDVGSTYSFYIASSTPVSEDVTVFETSDVQTLQNGEPVDNGNNLWIIGVVFGVFAAIAAIVVGIYIMKKRQNKGGSRKNSANGTEGPYQQSELYEPAGYDNVIVEAGKGVSGDNIEEEHPYLTIPTHSYEYVEPHDTED